MLTERLGMPKGANKQRAKHEPESEKGTKQNSGPTGGPLYATRDDCGAKGKKARGNARPCRDTERFRPNDCSNESADHQTRENGNCHEWPQ